MASGVTWGDPAAAGLSGRGGWAVDAGGNAGGYASGCAGGYEGSSSGVGSDGGADAVVVGFWVARCGASGSEGWARPDSGAGAGPGPGTGPGTGTGTGTRARAGEGAGNVALAGVAGGGSGVAAGGGMVRACTTCPTVGKGCAAARAAGWWALAGEWSPGCTVPRVMVRLNSGSAMVARLPPVGAYRLSHSSRPRCSISATTTAHTQPARRARLPVPDAGLSR